MSTGISGHYRLSIKAFKTSALAFLIAIALAAFLIPGSGGGALAWAEGAFRNIPDVGHEAERSQMPAATAIAYGLALLLGPVAALLLVLTNLDRRPILKFITQRAPISRLIVAVGFFCFVLVPFLIPVGVSQYQLSSGLVSVMAESRFWLMCWGGAVFFFQLVGWSIVAFTFISFIHSDQTAE